MSTSSGGSLRFGGVNAKNLGDVDIKFVCVLCKYILLYPWQLLCCGTILCKWCLKRGLSNSEPYICQFCHTKQTKKEASADRGIQRDLNMIRILCYSCPWNGLCKDYLEHLQELHADLECIDCRERFFAINSFEEHRQEICIHRCIPCGLPGCTALVKWYDMKMHYLSEQHQDILLIIVSRHVNQKKQQSNIHHHSEIIKTELEAIQESSDVILAAQEIISDDMVRIKAEANQIKTNLERNAQKIDELKKQENEIGEKMNTLFKFQNDIEKDVNHIRKKRETSEIKLLDTNSTITFRFNRPNYDEITSSFSPKFKTSEYGYIFMLRVCSTIQSNQAYLSIFLTLFNGEYSNLIPYPFPYNIYFILWDQTNQQKHIFYVLKPDPKSSSFARPNTEKNDEYGIIDFCPLGYLAGAESIYVKDGVFFIRIFIDFLNTGKNPFQSIVGKDNVDNNEIMSSQTGTTMIMD